MQVAKWGNSLAVRLPKKLVEQLGLKAGDELDFVVADLGRIEIRKEDRREKALRGRLENGFHLTSGHDSSSGCGQSRAVAGWPRSPRRRSATRLT